MGIFTTELEDIADDIGLKWCVSNEEKVPLDMFALRKGREWGASNARTHSSYEPFEEVNNFPMNGKYKLCCFMESDGNYGLLDIEPICPKEIRQLLLDAFRNDVVYIERSMSGNGIHAIIPRKYSSTCKYKKYAEILVNHHATFTCKSLTFDEAFNMDISTNQTMTEEDETQIKEANDIYDLFKKPQASTFKGGSNYDEYKAERRFLNGSHADLYNIMYNFEYKKTLEDFDNDYSRYEFGYASSLNQLIMRTAPNMIDEDAHFYNMHISKRSAAILISMVLKQKLPPRLKHEEYRNGLPWLLYIADKIVNSD